jgi:hypothetical protein
MVVNGLQFDIGGHRLMSASLWIILFAFDDLRLYLRNLTICHTFQARLGRDCSRWRFAGRPRPEVVLTPPSNHSMQLTVAYLLLQFSVFTLWNPKAHACFHNRPYSEPDESSPHSHIFPFCIVAVMLKYPHPRPMWHFVTCWLFYSEGLLTHSQTPSLRRHFRCECLLIIISACTLIWIPSPQLTIRGRAMPDWNHDIRKAKYASFSLHASGIRLT